MNNKKIEKKKETEKEDEELKEPIRACMNCGHTELDYIGKDSGDAAVIFLGSPLMGIYRCKNCGFEGSPLEFYSIEDYKKFLKMKEEKGELKEEQEIVQKQSSTVGKMYWAYIKTAIIASGILILIILILFVLSFIFGRGG